MIEQDDWDYARQRAKERKVVAVSLVSVVRWIGAVGAVWMQLGRSNSARLLRGPRLAAYPAIPEAAHPQLALPEPLGDGDRGLGRVVLILAN